MSKPIHVISLGAGVQSSTMALMAAHGEIEPMPHFAIFADTGYEPDAVMKHLQWLMSGNVLPYPVHIVKSESRADLWERETTTRRSGKSGNVYRTGVIPAFILDRKGNATPFARKCTDDYKIQPIRRFLQRERDGRDVVTWLGISTDEASRMKPAREPWNTTRFPLAMEHRMSRDDCMVWMRRNGYPEPPRSACVFCPLHGDDEWRRLRDHDPEGFAMAVALERKIHAAHELCDTPATRPYLHRSRVPLGEADIDGAEGRGQLSMFANECEGMCGL